MSLTYRFKRDDDELWLACFLAALSGAMAGDRPDPVYDAAVTADIAMGAIKKRRDGVQAPPLFEPLLQQHAVKQKTEEDDSSFAIGKL